jgi:MOSC domain-containing protein YiiM
LETRATGTLLSVQVGRIRQMQMPAALDGSAADGRFAVWESGIYKSAVHGPVRVTRDGMDGDQQSDLENHGGPDNIVLAYDAAHYPGWRTLLNLPDLSHGSFGENFTVTGFSDATVCIGDIWQVGADLRLQVTQARQPCFKLARRLNRPEIVKLVRETGRGGWYMRVLQEGLAEAGMPITLLSRIHPDWPASRAVQTMYARRVEPIPARQLAALPELSARWKEELLFEQQQQQQQ